MASSSSSSKALIKPLYFFLAFAVGLVVVYMTTPPLEVVAKFPSPYNAGKVQYRDSSTDTCYIYRASKVSCPADRALLKPQPLHE